jgi:hypothetical protein
MISDSVIVGMKKSGNERSITPKPLIDPTALAAKQSSGVIRLTVVWIASLIKHRSQ